MVLVLAPFALMHGVGATAFLDGRFDPSPPRREEVVVVGRRECAGRCSEYILRVGPGLAGEAERHLKVSQRVFRAVATGDRVIVETYDGRFGGAWYRVDVEAPKRG